MKHETVFDQLTSLCTVHTLTRMTSGLLDAYRAGRMGALRLLSRELIDWIDDPEMESSRLFSRLILLYHPDRLRHLEATIRDARMIDDEDGLLRVLRLFSAFEAVLGPGAPPRRMGEDEMTPTQETEEVHTYGEEDFDDVRSARDSWFEDGQEEFDFEAEFVAAEEDEDIALPGRGPHRTLFDAIYAREYGHVPTDFAQRHLEDYEGEMNLSDYEITDLEGAAHLTQIRILQLSENRLRSVARLGVLPQLEELYLADNQLEDIDGLERIVSLRVLDLANNGLSDLSPLFDLPALQYVNVLGNPVPVSHIQRLRQQGVIVIADLPPGPGVLPF